MAEIDGNGVPPRNSSDDGPTSENRMSDDGQGKNAGWISRENIRKKKKIILVVILAVAAIAAFGYWWRSTFWESTDDAQIDGHINPISARVGGHVIRIDFRDYQYVEAGVVLVEIDPTDYRVALERAKAEYAEALADAKAARTNVPISVVTSGSGISAADANVANSRAGTAAAEKQLEAARARLREAEANNGKAQADLERYRPLAERDIISRQQYDQAVAAARSAAATVDEARALVTAARKQAEQAQEQLRRMRAELESARTGPRQVSVTRSRAESANAVAMRYKAALDQAELNLRYTRVTAPVAGVVGKRTVEIGQNVDPGQVLLSIVPLEDIWVTANFKETQLGKMRPGQRAKIYVDTYKKTYDGHVDSITGASGARFSLFPPENATGNYVKVVQRIPVKIVFEKGQDRERLLRPGMSVEPEVRVK
ncbi:MAG TPA: HlyD family secretion protein [Geobacteraceae bacterium]|nr:HlyD family secretion protein [Geobacteraceae bacterium]